MPPAKIDILYTENKKPLQEVELRRMYELIPQKLRSHIDKHKMWKDKQASLLGKSLLAHWARINLNDEDILHKIFIDEKGRPNLPSEIDFNISHSKDIVVCAIDPNGCVGVDIEKILPIEIEDFKTYFSSAEAKLITTSKHTIKVFFDIWTKKEAIIKAAGNGFPPQLDNLDTEARPVAWEGNSWFINSLPIHPEYSCHVATLKKDTLLHLSQIFFDQLLF